MPANKITSLLGAVFVAFLGSCGGSVPDLAETKPMGQDAPVSREISGGIVLPRNIMPYNFVVNHEGECGAWLASGKYSTSIKADADGRIIIDADEWRRLKESGDTIGVTVCARDRENVWRSYNKFDFIISKDSIDPYLTYRLIEPSYQASGEIGLYCYNLENGEEEAIATVHREYTNVKNRGQKCMNCHHTQRGTKNSSFYYRGDGGGLIITRDGETRKINTKVGDMEGGTSYMAWHPLLPIIALSANFTRQYFMMSGRQKIEVFDGASDLMLYDCRDNTIRHICRTRKSMESFPEWSADGKTLYYVSSDSVVSLENLRMVRYDLYSIPFSSDNLTFSDTARLFCASALDSSVTMPKVSPDGKWIALTIAKYGVSTQFNKTADLAVFSSDFKRRLDASKANSDDVDSYHSWSSNSRWMVLASRRTDKNFMRLYLVHIDKDGNISSATPVPHTNPLWDEQLLKSYNVPELAQYPLSLSEREYNAAIYGMRTENATFVKTKEKEAADGSSGASQIQ